MARGRHYREHGGVFRTELRRKIYETVRRRGSATLSDLKRILKKAQGTVQYHLDTLEDEGFLVKSLKEEGGHHYRNKRLYRVSKNFSDYKPEAG